MGHIWTRAGVPCVRGRTVLVALIAGAMTLSAAIPRAQDRDDEAYRLALASEMIEIVARLHSKVPIDIHRSKSNEVSSGLEHVQPFLRIDGCVFEYHWNQYSHSVNHFDLRDYELYTRPSIDNGNDIYPPRATFGFRQSPDTLATHWQSSRLRQQAEREAEERLKAVGDPHFHRNARKEIAPRALAGEFGEYLVRNHYRNVDGGIVVLMSPVAFPQIFTRAEDAARFLYLIAVYKMTYCAE